jgi:HD-GYP domain-containing protein (c-di-GMP phosphodiesterase class II)
VESWVRVNRDEITIGWPLQYDIYDDKGILLLKKGYIPESQKQLDTLLDRGLYIREPFFSPRVTDASPPPEKTKKATPFELLEEIYQELSAVYKTPEKIDFPFNIFRLGKKIQLVGSINADAALGSLFLSRDWNYFVSHQIHCALICEVLLSKLGGIPEERLPLLAAGLTMNIGMIDLQKALVTKQGKLTTEERVKIRQHPLSGVELLHKYGVTDKTWLTIVRQHHESRDGSGYPEGLRGDEIDHLARLINIADVYSAKLSPRAYRESLPSHVAAREIFDGSRGQSFDKELIRIFLREFGLYHPGSFVRLANGEIALVTYRGKKIHHPVIHSIIKTDGTTFLSPKRRDCSKEEFKILDSNVPRKVNITINRQLVWGYWNPH